MTSGSTTSANPNQAAEVIDYNVEDPVEAIKSMTSGIGVDRVIDAVGVDANMPHSGPGAKKAKAQEAEFKSEQKSVAPKTDPHDGNWHPGDAPGQARSRLGESDAGTFSRSRSGGMTP